MTAKVNVEALPDLVVGKQARLRGLKAVDRRPELVPLPGDRGFISLDVFQHELPDQMGPRRQEAFEVTVGPHVYSERAV